MVHREPKVGVSREPWRRNVVTMGTPKKRRERSATPDTPERDATPPVMWPESGSGFEADPFSPAGMSKQIWTATGRRPRTRTGMWLVRVVCVLLALAFIISQIPHW